MLFDMCQLESYSRIYLKASQPTGWDVIVGDLDSYVAT